MKLLLHELEKPLSFTFTHEDGWIRNIFTNLDLSYTGPLTLQLQIIKEKESVFVIGHVRAHLNLTCFRCTENATYALDQDFSPTYVNQPESTQKDEAIHKSELDTTYFDGNELDLAEIFKEQLELLIPYRHLCKETCKGICQKCGQSLNLKACGCKEDAQPSPFEVLKNLKLKK